nr:MAG TPA: hypothetical protein [Caudoviricetes sp.]
MQDRAREIFELLAAKTAGWEKYDDVEKSEIQPDDAGSGQGNI